MKWLLMVIFLTTAVIDNPCPNYTFINSVDFHPQKNQFCVTYTHGNRVIIYELDAEGHPSAMQTLGNPEALLSEPQHAIFSRDGDKIFVANWTNQTLAVYKRKADGAFQKSPETVMQTAVYFPDLRPHGMAISPNGNYLAVAYGVSKKYGRGIVLYQIAQDGLNCLPISVLQDSAQLPGIPKGIVFSPDGTCLLVTFANLNSVHIFNVKDGKIDPKPRQIIQGKQTAISRPEDIKVTADGCYVAVSNSDKGNITFYPFDSVENRVTRFEPVHTVDNLCFPHGIAFSADGAFMVVTQFGHIATAKDGDPIFDKGLKADEPKVSVFRIDKDG